MDGLRNTFLGYRIYRRKFFSTVLIVLILSLAVFGGIMLFFINTWMTELRQQAQARFLEGERRLGGIQILAQDYVNGLYAERQLMNDTRALFESNNEAEYIIARRYNSLENQDMIISMPNSLRRLLLNNRIMISGVSMQSDNGMKVLWHDSVSGEIKMSFEAADEDKLKEYPQIGDLLVTTEAVRDPNHIDRTLGTLSFWARSEDIYEEWDMRADVWVVADRDGNTLNGSKNGEEALWLKEAVSQGTQSGWIDIKGFNRVFYAKFSSSQSNYTLVVMHDVKSLLNDRRYVVNTLLSAFILIGVGVLISSYVGIQRDANFLKDIKSMLSGMETGHFEQVQAIELPVYNRENEYGMIAAALKDVGMKLKGYIETEYILKLKEQETAIRALQHQINPHFLYNTLEMLRSKALMSGERDIADAIAMLGALYRERMHKKESISLREEFELLEKYLKIMSMRFGGNFVYQVELEEEIADIPTVTFWLQPLAENFFTHGFDRESEYNLLIVSGHAAEGGAVINIIDNGTGAEPEKLEEIRRNMYEGNDDPEADIGLRNVYMRLNYFYQEGFSMEVNNNAEGGFGITIFIPGKEGEGCTL